ncbi:hypothetical protein, partial [Ralstonia sp. Ralssp135]|uniref:hypothetical protein n=1 Tax=Ralstonia sp. Ralssp135 TaxID=3243016 RepID=UPI0039B0DF9F
FPGSRRAKHRKSTQSTESGSRMAFFPTSVQLIPARNAVNPAYLGRLRCAVQSRTIFIRDF